MTIKNSFLIIFFTAFFSFAGAQQFNYIQYNTKDGLAGSTVYDITQDKDGFIWFATENGLSRFDGKNFKNFTVKDGLPDNEVLKVFADSKGRVWIGAFNNQICYYYKGKIHNRNNDSLASKIKANLLVNMMTEAKGDIAILTGGKYLFIITNDGEVKEYDATKITNDKIDHSVFAANGFLFLKNMFKNFKYNSHTGIFTLFTTSNEQSYTKRGQYSIFIKSDSLFHPIRVLTAPSGFMSHEMNPFYTDIINTTDGSWEIDTATAKYKYHFLPGKKVVKCFRDIEDNYWFCTIGEGIFKMSSVNIKTYVEKKLLKNSESNNEVFSIDEFNNKIYGGLNFSRVMKVDKNDNFEIDSYESSFRFSANSSPVNRLYCMDKVNDNVFILGFDGFIAKITKQKLAQFNYIFPIKSVETVNDSFFIAGTSSFTYKMRVNDLSIIDTIWRGRCTKLFYTNHKYYIGTLDGLYELNEQKQSTYLGQIHPTLTRRIADIKKDVDGILWIASSDNGVVGYDNGKIIRTINETNGLSSNICKSLFIEKDFLWVGTNKGLNKINLKNLSQPILKYSSLDGLPSDVINAVYVTDSLVWVGTPAGLTYFVESSISKKSICNLQILSATVSGKDVPIDSTYKLDFKNNNIGFSYTGISFKSAGEITFYYRLLGLHDDWRSTTQDFLNYQALEPGNYTLEIYAVNKFGKNSVTKRIAIKVETPFWRSWWFYTLIFLGVLGVLIFYFSRRQKLFIKKIEAENKVQKQFAELEQQALQAQMNPHFIFNCLSSIQQYILIGDSKKTNEYLSDFAKLVRLTLDYSGKKSITLEEEKDYLRQYLKMEMMRYGDSFSYEITIQPELNQFSIPALMIQPFVENSLRHGIRYLEKGSGKIEIQFYKEENTVICSVKDNGIGREAAKKYKGIQHIEYQSKGLQLTQRRMDLLNQTSNEKINFELKDLKDSTGNAAGTEVIIKFPYYEN